MGIFACLLVLTVHFLVNFEQNSDIGQLSKQSFLSLKEFPSANNESNELAPEQNITSKIPTLFMDVDLLELTPTEESKNSHLFKYSNTSLALDCYQKLPQYTVIVGLLKEYSYFLTVYYRVKCENGNNYNDETKCGRIPYVIDLLDNKAEILAEKKKKKENECFKYESNIVSVQYRFFDDDEFVGRSHSLSEEEILIIEKSFLRRMVMEYEQLLINKTISYEVYCISKLKYNGEIDCYRLRLESWFLEHELNIVSEEYFKRILRFKRQNDTS